MKEKEKVRARQLRKQGLAINEIYKQLGVAKSSVSLWVRDIELTKRQKRQLTQRGQSKEAIEKRRITRLARESARRKLILDEASKTIRKISRKELLLIGAALYWAEGGKTNRGMVRFSNSDPLLIKIMMLFLKAVCAVPAKKFKGHIHLHPHLDPVKARRHWSRISGIPSKQFFKTSQQYNRASKGKKDSLPYGTFTIYVCDTALFLKIAGWMQGLYKNI